jgi:hypothetical protein
MGKRNEIPKSTAFDVQPIQRVIAENVYFQLVSKEADLLKLEVYLVGGFVRDQVLGRESKDADFVTIGDCFPLAQAVAEASDRVLMRVISKTLVRPRSSMAIGFWSLFRPEKNPIGAIPGSQM